MTQAHDPSVVLVPLVVQQLLPYLLPTTAANASPMPRKTTPERPTMASSFGQKPPSSKMKIIVGAKAHPVRR